MPADPESGTPSSRVIEHACAPEAVEASGAVPTARLARAAQSRPTRL